METASKSRLTRAIVVIASLLPLTSAFANDFTAGVLKSPEAQEPGKPAGLPEKPAESPDAASDPLHTGEPVPNGAVAVIDSVPVSNERFLDELLDRYLRPGAAGHKVLAALEDEILIRHALKARGINIDDRDVEDKLNEIDEVSRATQGKGIREILEETHVPLEAFRRKTRGLVALERLAREDHKVPPGKPVENFHLLAWLKQAKEAAKIETDRAKMPAGVMAVVDGEAITRNAFARELLLAIEPAEARRVVDTLIQEKLIDRLLVEYRLEVTPEDLLAEWELRKREFEADPLHHGVSYEQVLEQQTGLSPEEFRKSSGFRVNAALGLIARSVFSDAQVERAYEVHKELFGPHFHVRRILVLASDDPRAKDSVRSVKEGRKRMDAVLQDLDKGADFKDLARLYSDESASRFRGGLISPFTPGRHSHDAPFVEAVKKLEVGEVSKPVLSREGWNLIRLDRIQPTPAVSELGAEIRRLLAGDLFREAWEKAKIGVDVRL